MNEPTILHSDVNNFFASVECATRPELANKAVIVAGDVKKRTGIVLAKNEIAKRYGITTGQSIYEAQKACPDVVCLEPHYPLYEQISKELHQIYLDYSDQVEPLGLDECWIDVTSSQKILGKNGFEIANEIRERVKQTFGFTVSVGVSFNKVYAKLGSDIKKPDAVTVIPRDRLETLVYPLPLNSIVGIDKRLEKKFKLINISTIGEFCKLEESFISSLMGITGVKLLNELRGGLGEKVRSYFNLPPPKSFGNGTTTIKDIYNRADIEKVLAFLAEKVSKRLIESGYEARTISVSLKTKDLERLAHSTTIPSTFASSVLLREAMRLVESFYNFSTPLRAMRLRASNLNKINVSRQMSLFDQKADLRALGVQKITAKYGSDSLVRASEFEKFINRKKHTET